LRATIPQADRRALVVRLRRVEGQLRGIQTMIESESSCEQVAQQMAAARKALDRAFFATVACAIKHEIGGGSLKKEEAKQRIAEMTELLSRFA
jgi:DNA-binding FrmR family transcriptional regulator